MVILTYAAPFVLQRVSWHESRSFLLVNLVSAAIVFLLVLVFWPVGALIRRHYGRPLALGAGERQR